MPHKLQRLFVKSSLKGRGKVELDTDHVHYLGNVLRLHEGEKLLVFNGKDGEWCAELGVRGKYSIVPYPACVGWMDRDVRKRTGLICTICSRRSSVPASIIWCRKPPRWV